MKACYHTYGNHGPISHEELIRQQEREGMFWAHAENSGSESCYVEVAKWHDGDQKWYRYCFEKAMNIDREAFDLDGDLGDFEVAKHVASLINAAFWFDESFPPIIHSMANYPRESEDAAIVENHCEICGEYESECECAIPDVPMCRK